MTPSEKKDILRKIGARMSKVNDLIEDAYEVNDKGMADWLMQKYDGLVEAYEIVGAA